MNEIYFAGLDLGQSQDYTALAILARERIVTREAETLVYAVRHLQRFELGTPYPKIVEGVHAVLTRPPLDRTLVLLTVDKTGCGRLAARCIRTHVKTWDVKAADDSLLPIEDGTILQLKDVLFNRLFGIITTQDAPDTPGGQQQDDEQDALLDDALKAIETGRGLHEVREERQRKN